MSQTQRNYNTGDRELLAIIRALEEWRHYIQGSPHTLDISNSLKTFLLDKHARHFTFQNLI